MLVRTRVLWMLSKNAYVVRPEFLFFLNLKRESDLGVINPKTLPVPSIYDDEIL
jgi:hypothetical protein